MTVTIHAGDARTALALLPAASVQCCVTSPPYYGLRDYGVDGQIGLEPTPDEYVAEMVAVFREVRRVLRDDGTLWLNIGDSYSTHAAGKVANPMAKSTLAGVRNASVANRTASERTDAEKRGGIPEKNLLGIPWLLAFALRADGWYLRSDIIWHKPNPMPESVRDRPTSAHEHVFLLTKSARYFYDAAAIKEEAAPETAARYAYGFGGPKNSALKAGDKPTAIVGTREFDGGRNARNVWTIASRPFSGAHFATMPTTLAERCVLAGTKMGDTVLDPFGGAGTTALAADRLGRNAVLIELNPDYITLAHKRIADDQEKRKAPLDTQPKHVLTCYNDQPAGVAMPTLITFATDNPEDAKKIMEALYGAPAQTALPLAAAAPKATPKVAAKAPDPASTVTTTVSAPAVPAAPPPPAAPAAVVPPPQPVAPPPAPAAVPQGEPEPGWTLEHVKGMARSFLTSPKGGPDKLEAILTARGAEAVGTAPPQVWHLLYADMAAILEAA